jgi:anti-sigma-K factor RskA
MDSKEILNSGWIELYVLGALTDAEAQAIEKAAALDPAVANEIAASQAALNVYSKTVDRNPRPAMRDKILQQIPEAKNQIKTVAMVKDNAWQSYKYLMAACLAALVISTYSSYFFYDKWSEAEDRYLTMQQEKNVMADQFSIVKNDFDKAMNDLLVIKDGDMSMFTLTAIDTSKNYNARVYMDKRMGRLYIDVLSLPMPEPGKQYQLWAMVNGAPIDAGVFDIDPTNTYLQALKTIPNAAGFAVTLEQQGGSATPTLEQLYIKS